MKATTFALIAAVMAGTVQAHAQTNAPAAWAHAYEASALPGDSKPAWSRHGNGQARIENATLVLSSTTEGSEYYRLRGSKGDPVWDGSQGAILEFRMRVRETAPGSTSAAEVTIADGKQYYSFSLTNTAFQTYRLVLGLSGAELFILHDDKPAGKGTDPGRQFAETYPSEERNYLYFGDGSRGSGGVSEWKFLRWINKLPTDPR